MGARSQIENRTYLLTYKDMLLMGREQSHIKETKETAKYETENVREKSTVSLPIGWKKVCFKVKISRHGKWNSNDSSNCQIVGAILKGKCLSLRSLISPEWNHSKCLMIFFYIPMKLWEHLNGERPSLELDSFPKCQIYPPWSLQLGCISLKADSH